MCINNNMSWYHINYRIQIPTYIRLCNPSTNNLLSVVLAIFYQIGFERNHHRCMEDDADCYNKYDTLISLVRKH